MTTPDVEARRRYADDPARAALKRVLASITKKDHDLPGPTPVNARLLEQIGPVYSKIQNAYEQQVQP